MLDSKAKIVLDTRSPGRDSSIRPFGPAAMCNAHCLPVSALATAWGLGGGTGLVLEKDSRMGGTTTGIATPARREDGRRRRGQVKLPDGREAREPREAWSFGNCSERRKREMQGERAMHAVVVQECRAEDALEPDVRAALRSPKNPLSVWATSLRRVIAGRSAEATHRERR